MDSSLRLVSRKFYCYKCTKPFSQLVHPEGPTKAQCPRCENDFCEQIEKFQSHPEDFSPKKRVEKQEEEKVPIIADRTDDTYRIVFDTPTRFHTRTDIKDTNIKNQYGDAKKTRTQSSNPARNPPNARQQPASNTRQQAPPQQRSQHPPNPARNHSQSRPQNQQRHQQSHSQHNDPRVNQQRSQHYDQQHYHHQQPPRHQQQQPRTSYTYTSTTTFSDPTQNVFYTSSNFDPTMLQNPFGVLDQMGMGGMLGNMGMNMAGFGMPGMNQMGNMFPSPPFQDPHQNHHQRHHHPRSMGTGTYAPGRSRQHREPINHFFGHGDPFGFNNVFGGFNSMFPTSLFGDFHDFFQVDENLFARNFMQNFHGVDPYDIAARMSEQSYQPQAQPTSKEAIRRLPKVKIEKKHCKQNEKGELEHPSCTICCEDFALGVEGLFLPCGHIFHPDCIKPWLEQHRTCPVCRHELPTA